MPIDLDLGIWVQLPVELTVELVVELKFQGQGQWA